MLKIVFIGAKEWIYGDGKHIFQDQNNDLHIWYQG